MLFDLRGRGRRTTVRIIYIGLAVLLGVGLVGFGIGGGFGGGGLFSAATNNEGARSASFAKQVAKYRKLTRQQPQNVAGWEKLTKVLLNEAGGAAYSDPTTGAVTDKGRKVYGEAADAWNHYIALKPAKPSIPLAKSVVRIFGLEGLNQAASAVQVLQILVAAEPQNTYYYESLAEYAYLAGDDRIGDLASAKAVSLAPVGQRTHVKTQLAAIKKQIHEKKSGTGSTGAGATATTPGGGTITVPSKTTGTGTTSGGK